MDGASIGYNKAMKDFIYKVTNAAGQIHRGHLEAEDEQIARDRLTSAGFRVEIIRHVEETDIPLMELARELEEGDS